MAVLGRPGPTTRNGSTSRTGRAGCTGSLIETCAAPRPIWRQNRFLGGHLTQVRELGCRRDLAAFIRVIQPPSVASHVVADHVGICRSHASTASCGAGTWHGLRRRRSRRRTASCRGGPFGGPRSRRRRGGARRGCRYRPAAAPHRRRRPTAARFVRRRIGARGPLWRCRRRGGGDRAGRVALEHQLLTEQGRPDGAAADLAGPGKRIPVLAKAERGALVAGPGGPVEAPLPEGLRALLWPSNRGHGAARFAAC